MSRDQWRSAEQSMNRHSDETAATSSQAIENFARQSNRVMLMPGQCDRASEI